MINKGFHTVRGYQLMEQDHRLLTSAMEDYLEMIYRNSLQEGSIRINKIAALLNVKTPSASKMVQKLEELGMLKYERYGIVTLTDKGRKMGEALLERHKVIETLLKLIGCSEDVLSQTELIEHNINNSTLENIKILINFFENNQDIKDLYIKYRRSLINKK
ncbi:MAG: DtxR family transcriptional regulator [Clostridiales bacterium]|jgi:Mn-dependent DtxR family transcriptional regulator|nr:DtxR family transcriptional regulator [Clostridiales bacterium]